MTDIRLVKENQQLQKQLKTVTEDLKKMKDSKNVMYFRNDRKTIELKKAMKEKEKLTHHISTLEDRLQNLKTQDTAKSQEIAQLKAKIEEMGCDMNLLKESYENKIKATIQKIEKPLK